MQHANELIAAAAMVGRWLLKTEPEEWSWDHQQANGGISNWDGVRNAQAQKHLRAMEQGDLCLFYHSGAKAKEIVGIARVCKPFYPDPSDTSCKHGMVDIEAVSKFSQPLTLSQLKQEAGLSSFIMFRQPRLSVVPVSPSEWTLICELAGEVDPPLVHGSNDLSASAEKACEPGSKVIKKPPSPHHDSEVRVRVIDQAAECDEKTIDGLAEADDMLNQSSRKSKKRPGKTTKAADANGVKINVSGSIPHAEASHSLAEVAEVLIAEEGDDNSINVVLAKSIATKVAGDGPTTRRVYSRRTGKHSQVGPVCINAETNDVFGMASAGGGRVYKRRNR